jgi:hypothetical protein
MFQVANERGRPVKRITSLPASSSIEMSPYHASVYVPA